MPAAYSIEFAPAAERDFGGLPKPIQQRVADRIGALASDPRPFGVTKLKGREGRYRIRAGDYRIIYDIDDTARRVVICIIGHRGEVYRGL